MIPVTHEEFADLFPVYYRSKEAVFVHGNIGIGKSQSVRVCARQEAERQDREFVKWHSLNVEEKKAIVDGDGDLGVEDAFIYVDVRLAESEPSDLRGLPDFENGYTDWKPPLWVAAICTDEAAGVVFLDEANLAPELIQSVFYQLVLDRKISQRSIADGVYVLGAGNTTEDEAHIHEMAGPLRDRFAHLRLERPEGGVDGDWIEWAIDADIDPRIVGFIGSDVGQQCLYTFGADDADSTVFATPRSWERVDSVIEDAPSDFDHLEELIASFVGPGSAAKFTTFLAHREKFDVSGYLDDPTSAAELNERQFDEAHARLSAIAEAYSNGDTDVETVTEIAEVVSTEYAAYLLTLCRQYADDTDAFRNDLTDAVSGKEFAEDVVRVIAK